MDPKVAGSSTPSYEEIEPFCSWQREVERDVLAVHLPEFKKNQLKVQINNHGILKISGERQVNAAKRSKFYKEVAVPKNCITDDIRAKFVNGCLYISMPKRVDQAAAEQLEKNTPGQDQTSESQPMSSSPPAGEAGINPHQEKMTVPSSNGNIVKPKSVSRAKRCGKVALNLAATFVVLAALSAFCVYIFRKTVLED